MSTVSAIGPQPGQIAFVRQRLYLVERVEPPAALGDSTLVSLSCVDDDAQGQPLEVLWEREIDREIRSAEDWNSVAAKGFDPPDLFAAYLNTLRWNCVTSTDPRLLQSPFRAGIRIDAYQLEPLRKALLLPRVNMFIADDVGLGKTIEAGLIARELLLRKKVHEIVVCCPPSMIYQWKDELEARFGLTFEVLDKDYMKRIRSERGFGVNPWSTHPRFLVSQRLLIDEVYAGPLRDWLGSFRSGSLLILDEAHHAAPSSGQKYAIDSHITRAVRDLAPRFEHRLFLSATPHNGHSNSFSALLEILDPQRFCRGVPVTQKALNDVMVRRLKDDIREVQGGFPKREVIQIDIDGLPSDAPELRLPELLDEYRRLREQRLLGQTKRKQAAAGLLITGLQQRLLSSVDAFARTLRVHRRTAEKHWEEGRADDYDTKMNTASIEFLAVGIDSDDERAILSESDIEVEEDEAVVQATVISADLRSGSEAAIAAERRLIDEMSALAERSRYLPDARLRKLLSWIQDRMCRGVSADGAGSIAESQWSDIRIILFTEYEDTKRYLFQQLSTAIAGTSRADARIAVFCGSTPSDEREEIKLAFNADPGKHPVRILIATDAAREGLNLQAHCWNLFHFDVPWNPSRMEQRNGRIDRKLQPSETVNCHYFVHSQRPEDRILSVLVRKTETIKKELGCLSQVIDERLADALKSGIRRENLAKTMQDIESVDLEPDRKRAVMEELEASRDRQQALRVQIDKLRTQLEHSNSAIGLDQPHFQSAISCALRMLGAPPLAQVPGDVDGPRRYIFPPLDQLSGAGLAWADTMDTLREPRRRDEQKWDWQRSSPVRPVVFEDTGTLDDGVVHLHLEQRAVQRLLGRFTAQGFVYHDLSRACFAQADDAIPRVVLIGRLSLYGPGAARLHEEIVSVAARWRDPESRTAPLTLYTRESEQKTLALLQSSLLTGPTRPVAQQVLSRLQASASGDVAELLPYLHERAEEHAADAGTKLHARADAESDAMRAILDRQRKYIAESIAKHDGSGGQLAMEFTEDEQRQRQADRRHWGRRLTELEGEIVREPERVRAQYEVRATRIEPLGLVYLWPVTG